MTEICYNYDMKQSKEHIKRRSIALTGRKLSPEHARKNKEHGFQKGERNAFEGRKHTQETKRKMSIIRLGKKLSMETRKRMGIARRGANSPFWKGGISDTPYSVDWTHTLKRSIRERDKYTCQICGEEPATVVHHIDYNKFNCNPDNLVCLCRRCHAKTNQNRSYWIEYFNKDK